MDIQKYEAFIKTAELGSIKKASEALGYTQAGLSYIIKTLEEELDISFSFAITAKSISLAAARKLLPLAHAICNDQRRLKTRLSELKNLQSGNITIAVFTSIAVYWLPYLMKGFLEKHPGIRFDVKCYEEPAVLDEMLDNGDVDFGFTVLPDADASFEKSLFKERSHDDRSCREPPPGRSALFSPLLPCPRSPTSVSEIIQRWTHCFITIT